MRHDLSKLARAEVERYAKLYMLDDSLPHVAATARRFANGVFERAYKVGLDDGRDPFLDDSMPAKGRQSDARRDAWDRKKAFTGRLQDNLAQLLNVDRTGTITSDRVVVDPPWAFEPQDPFPPVIPVVVSWWFDQAGKPHPFATIKKEKPMALRVKRHKLLYITEDFLRTGDDWTARANVLCGAIKMKNPDGIDAILRAVGDMWDRKAESVVLFTIASHLTGQSVFGNEFFGASDATDDAAAAPQEEFAAAPASYDSIATTAEREYELYGTTCDNAHKALELTIKKLHEDAAAAKLSPGIVSSILEAVRSAAASKAMKGMVESLMDAIQPKDDRAKPQTDERPPAPRR